MPNPTSPAAIDIAVETPRQDEIVRLLEESDRFALALYPPEGCYLLDVGELEGDGVTVFVARHAGRAAGMAALVDRGDGTAELKRMIVLEEARGRGIASALLRAIEDAARDLGIHLIQLETGTKHVAATALYEKHGYRHIPKFGQYVESEYSVCMERSL